MVYWINENSLACSARLNRGIESADIVWIMCQDPISSKVRSKLLQALRRKRPEVPIINAPAAYNFYHMPGAFERLACAGVRVPRSAFSSTDIGRTRVVYKKQDMQAAEKFVALYDGERRGFNAFEFCDLKGSDGLYRRYRAHYLAGFVRPSSLMLSPQWNVCLKHMVRQEFSFQMSVFEKDQVRRIAAESALDFFAVDYVMDPDQGMPVFTDINVYPNLVAPLKRAGHSRGQRGVWHIFDARTRLGLPEPSGREFILDFDEVLVSFATEHDRAG
jgi:hypothetical protein